MKANKYIIINDLITKIKAKPTKQYNTSENVTQFLQFHHLVLAPITSIYNINELFMNQVFYFMCYVTKQ
jgi:hypothetical protein